MASMHSSGILVAPSTGTFWKDRLPCRWTRKWSVSVMYSSGVLWVWDRVAVKVMSASTVASYSQKGTYTPLIS